jgi:hypothetical protein
MDMTISDFISWWREHNAAIATGAGAGASSGGGAEAEEGGAGGRELLYVKDWHFQKDFPQYLVSAGEAAV